VTPPPDEARDHDLRFRGTTSFMPQTLLVLPIVLLGWSGRLRVDAGDAVPPWARVGSEQRAVAQRLGIPVAFENRWSIDFARRAEQRVRVRPGKTTKIEIELPAAASWATTGKDEAK